MFKKIPIPWLVLWSAIYIIFLILDLFFPGSIIVTTLKLGGLVSCLIYACLHSPRDRLLIFALAFTLLADIVLAINHLEDWGIFVFCIAQFAHLFRLTTKVKTKKARGNHMEHIYVNVTAPLSIYLLAAVVMTIVTAAAQLSAFYVLVSFYAVALITNLIFSALRRHRHRNPSNTRLLLGFILFVLCDLCVALSFISNNGTLTPVLQSVFSYLAWLFYFPSQIFICTSGKSVIQ